MAQVGYVRVSSVGQNLDRQLDGLELDKIFTDKISGASLKRPGLQACLNYMREGDQLHVHSMCRLSRNLESLQQTVRELNAQGIVVKFHKESLKFTGDDSPMAKLMLQMMGAVAEFERSLIKERQAEGIKKAQERGVKFGRKSKLKDPVKREIIALVDAGQEKKAVAEKYGISRPTLYQILKDRDAGKIQGPADAQMEIPA